MKTAHLVLSRLYWLVVATLPFLPWYMLNAISERLACEYGTPCFEHGLPYLVEGSVAGLSIGIVLWPMCVWQLGGWYLWSRLRNGRGSAGLK